MQRPARTSRSGSSTSLSCRHTVEVTVILLNKDTLQIPVDPKSKLTEVFNQVCEHLNLRESEFFGLAQHIDGEYRFLDLDTKLRKLLPKSKSRTAPPPLKVFFRVQFYVDHVALLRERSTRQLYYQQLRENVLEYNQLLSEEKCFLIAAYALQAEQGNYDPIDPASFDPRQYFPAWVISKHGPDYILSGMPMIRQDLAGMARMEAQMCFIRDVSALPTPHNLHLYQLKLKKGEPLGSAWLGVCARGIEVYEVLNGFKSLLSTFLWSSIAKLGFEKKKFEIRVAGAPEGRKFTYYTSSDSQSKYLFSLCRATHVQQMNMQPKLAEIKRLDEEDEKRYRENYIDSYPGDLRWDREPSPRGSKLSICRPLRMSGEAGSTDPRVSVISNASSNTTSGIVSDKMHFSLEESEDDRSVEIMIDSPPVSNTRGNMRPLSYPVAHSRIPNRSPMMGTKAMEGRQPVSRSSSNKSQGSNKLRPVPEHNIPSQAVPEKSATVVMSNSSGSSVPSGAYVSLVPAPYTLSPVTTPVHCVKSVAMPPNVAPPNGYPRANMAAYPQAARQPPPHNQTTKQVNLLPTQVAYTNTDGQSGLNFVSPEGQPVSQLPYTLEGATAAHFLSSEVPAASMVASVPVSYNKGVGLAPASGANMVERKAVSAPSYPQGPTLTSYGATVPTRSNSGKKPNLSSVDYKYSEKGASGGTAPDHIYENLPPAKPHKHALVVTGSIGQARERQHRKGDDPHRKNMRRPRASTSCGVCAEHKGVDPTLAEQIRGMTKNLSLPLLNALCNDTSLIMQTSNKCTCCIDQEHKRLSVSYPHSSDNLEGRSTPSGTLRRMSWHSETFTLDADPSLQTFHSTHDAQAQQASPYVDRVLHPGLIPPKLSTGRVSAHSQDTVQQPHAGISVA